MHSLKKLKNLTNHLKPSLKKRRLFDLIDKTKVVIGGECDSKEKYISPTVMFNCTRNDKVMQEEIFGPILPFVTIQNYQEAIDFINAGYL